MASNHAYQVVPLRYFPSLITEEFINVGVVLVCPASGWWDARVATQLKPLRGLFPTFQSVALRSALRRISQRLRHARRERLNFDLLTDGTEELNRIVGTLVGALRWGDPHVEGVSSDPEAELEHWFRLLVRIAKEDALEPRVSGKVVEPTAQELMHSVLSAKGLWNRLQPVRIESYYSHDFDFAHRNGKLRVFQPIDLLQHTPKKIFQTAEAWRGRIDSLGDKPNEPFVFVPFVRLPKDREAGDAATVGFDIIRNARAPEVKAFTSDDLEEFSEYVAEVTSDH